jgi:hypothetical protein
MELAFPAGVISCTETPHSITQLREPVIEAEDE